MNIRLTTEPTGLEAAREDALQVLSTLDPIHDKDHYAIVIAQVHTLSTLIAAEQREKLSPNTVVLGLVNVWIALKVINYEETNIVTTKVLPFLFKKI